MLILGGHNSRAALSDVHVLRVESVTWETIEVAGVAPVCGNRHATAPPRSSTSTLGSTLVPIDSKRKCKHEHYFFGRVVKPSFWLRFFAP